MEHCACSGEWVGTGPVKGEVVGRLANMKRIARWYGLGMLEAVVMEVEEGL